MYQQEAAQPTANTTIGLDATSLTTEVDGDLPLHQQFWLRLRSIRTNTMRVRTSFKVNYFPGYLVLRPLILIHMARSDR